MKIKDADMKAMKNTVFGYGPVAMAQASYEHLKAETLRCKDERDEEGYRYYGTLMDIAHKAWIAMEEVQNSVPMVI